MINRKHLFVWILAAGLPALSIGAATETNPDPAANNKVSEASICNGVYSMEQAQQGQETFIAQCTQCHGANFRGGFGVASLVGSSFTTLWGDKTLWSLFDKMRSTMPLDRPGALSDEDYVALLARILEVNDFPAGDVAELPVQQEALEKLALPKECP